MFMRHSMMLGWWFYLKNAKVKETKETAYNKNTGCNLIPGGKLMYNTLRTSFIQFFFFPEIVHTFIDSECILFRKKLFFIHFSPIYTNIKLIDHFIIAISSIFYYLVCRLMHDDENNNTGERCIKINFAYKF